VDEAALIEALKARDERAFRQVVDAWSPALLRVATTYVPSRAAAEEVVQETWIAVLNGLDGFEGRSSLKTWVFRILTNVAMRGGGRERRSVPFSTIAPAGPSVDPGRFLPEDHEQWPGHWALPPSRWPTPDEGLMAGETRAVIVAALEALPPAQRIVIALRDIGGWSAEDVAGALDISAGNQRVLLHRARTALRAAVEHYFDSVTPGAPTDTEGVQ
jgi:RNA polymerase sigma-70 factor, ECF subfamily